MARAILISLSIVACAMAMLFQKQEDLKICSDQILLGRTYPFCLTDKKIGE